MKNKIAAYIVVFILAFVAAVALVTVSGNQDEASLDALNATIPASAKALIILEDPEKFMSSLEYSIQMFTHEQVNMAGGLANSLGLRGDEPIKSLSDLEKKVGINMSSPLGYAQLDLSPVSGLAFVTLKSETIFKDFLSGFAAVTEKSTDKEVKYFQLTSKKDTSETPTSLAHIAIKDNIAFLCRSDYYLKKVFDEKTKPIKSNAKYYKLFNKYENSNLRLYIDTEVIAQQAAAFLSMGKPSITAEATNALRNIPKEKFPIDVKSVGPVIDHLVDKIVSLLQIQQAIYLGAGFKDNALQLTVDCNLKLQPETASIFAQKLGSNPLLEKFPSGAFFVVVDNSTLDQKKLSAKISADLIAPIAKLIFKSDEFLKDAFEEPTVNEREVFAMYPGDSIIMPYKQMVMNYCDKDTNWEAEIQKEFDKINAVFAQIKKFIPMEMKFMPADAREHHGLKLRRYFLNFKFDKSFQGKDRPGMMMPGFRYPFEMGRYENICFFAGGDFGKNFGDFAVKAVQGKIKEKIADEREFKRAQKQALKDAQLNLYISVTNYMGAILRQIEKMNPKSESRISNKLDSYNTIWNLFSLKHYDEGIEVKLHISLKDIKQTVEIAKSLNYLSKGY